MDKLEQHAQTTRAMSAKNAIQMIAIKNGEKPVKSVAILFTNKCSREPDVARREALLV